MLRPGAMGRCAAELPAAAAAAPAAAMATAPPAWRLRFGDVAASSRSIAPAARWSDDLGAAPRGGTGCAFGQAVLGGLALPPAAQAQATWTVGRSTCSQWNGPSGQRGRPADRLCPGKRSNTGGMMAASGDRAGCASGMLAADGLKRNAWLGVGSSCRVAPSSLSPPPSPASEVALVRKR
eukprot:364809-Chlamydomonas_euryale.AAC.20